MHKYKERKTKNLVSLEKEGNGFLIKQKRFNPEEGTEIDDLVEKQTVAGIQVQIDHVEALLADLNQLKTDAEAL